MTDTVSQLLPIGVLALAILSIRTQPSIRNFFVILICLIVSLLAPRDSVGAFTVPCILSIILVLMSPLKRMLSSSIGRQKVPETSEPENPEALSILYPPTNAEKPLELTVDIVAVHGLGSSVTTTWTHKKSQKLWLRDFLPNDIRTARVMTFRHNSKWKSGALVKTLEDYGRDLLIALDIVRTTAEEKSRPILLIGHSFGGLVIESALVTASHPAGQDEITKKRNESIKSSVAGVIFLGTPHGGSDYTLLGKLYCMFHYWEGASTDLLSHLDPGSSFARRLLEDFTKSCSKIPAFDFIEGKQNIILGFPVRQVVTRMSGHRLGSDYQVLDTDHFGLNKFDHASDASYKCILGRMRSMIEEREKKDNEEISELHDRDSKLLKKLDPLKFGTENPLEGTCKWLTKEPIFTAWAQWAPTDRFLWIYGNPGSGKTFMSHFMCDYLRRECGCLVAAFFFSSRDGSEDRKSLKKFFQTILHQILSELPRNGVKNTQTKKNCFEKVWQMFHKTANPKISDYQQALREVLEIWGKTAIIVIDALDECTDASSDQLRELMGALKRIPQLHVLITSRPRREIDTAVGEDSVIRGGQFQLSDYRTAVNNDIRRYINSQIDDEDSLFPSGMEQVSERVLGKANGMILYAKLVFDILKNVPATTKEDLLQKVDELPQELDKLYANILAAIKEKGEDAQDFAVRVFQWLVVCRSPPTLSALLAVDTIRRTYQNGPGQDRPRLESLNSLSEKRFKGFLQKHCWPLVTIGKDEIVRIVHTSFVDFLKAKHAGMKDVHCPPAFQINPPVVHGLTGLVCVTCIGLVLGPGSAIKDSRVDLVRPLRDYAVLEWQAHIKIWGPLIWEDKEKAASVEHFCRDDDLFVCWVDARAKIDRRFGAYFDLSVSSHSSGPDDAVRPTPLHVAALFNLNDLGRFFVSDFCNTKDATGNTPLHIAAGQPEDPSDMVRNLLHAGARADVPDKGGSFPLHKAARRGNHGALAELLKKGDSANPNAAPHADPNVTDSHRFTPLHIACQLGFAECVQALLDAGAHVLPSPTPGATPSDDASMQPDPPISLAVENGHVAVVELLLKHDPSQKECCGRPLVQAARKGSVDTVKFLCKAGVDPNAKDAVGQTALHKACIASNLELVRYFLEDLKLDPEVREQSERTPLYFAAEKGDLDIVNCLLKNNADPNALDRRRETAIFKPAGRGHLEVVKRLLEAGTDITILDLWVRSPLRFAVMYGHANIVSVLVEADYNGKKIDQHLRDWAGLSALHIAGAWLREGQEDIVDILVDHGANPELLMGEEAFRGTALHAALRRVVGQPPATDKLISRLIARGVPVGVRSKHGWSALIFAVATKHTGAVKLLLDNGADPNDDCLHTAAGFGSFAMVKMILGEYPKRASLDLGRCNWRHQTALHIAASGTEEAHSDIVDALLAVRAPTMCLDMDGMTPLMRARESGHARAVKSIEDHEKRLEASGGSRLDECVGRSPLHTAVLSQSLSNVRHQLGDGGGISATDKVGYTPLHYAARLADPEVIRAVLAHEKAAQVVNAVDGWGRTPLHLASEQGCVATARALLEAGAGVEADRQGQTPLHVAALRDHGEVVESILEHERTWSAVPHRDNAGRTVLHIVAMRSATTIESILRVNKDAKFVDCKNDDGKTALHFAARARPENLAAVRCLLDGGALAYRTDNGRCMPGHYAADVGNSDVLRALIEAIPLHVKRTMEEWYQRLPDVISEEDGLDSSLRQSLNQNLALPWCETEAEDGGGHFMVHGSAWTEENRTSLELAVTTKLLHWDDERHSTCGTLLNRVLDGCCDMGTVRLILDSVPDIPTGALPYVQNDAVQLAAKKGQAEILGLLASRGADVNSMGDGQITALHQAAENGHGDAVRLLLDAGAHPDRAGLHGGFTPLHLAARGGHAAVTALLTAQAYVDATDDLRRTALHWACLLGHDKVVSVLLEAGASVLAQDADSRTPLEMVGKLNESTREQLTEQAERQRPGSHV